MTAPPSYQRYPKDVVSSGEKAVLSLEEFGALTRLMDYDWIEVGLPMDLRILAKLLRISDRKMQKLWKTLSKFFPQVGDRWMNPELEIEREKQAARRASLSENGKKGGRPTKPKAFIEETKGFPDEKQLKSLASSSAVAVAVNTTLHDTVASPPLLVADVLTDRLPAPEDRVAVGAFLTHLPPEKHAVWIARLSGWLDGLDTPSGLTITPASLGTALRDYVDQPGDFSPAHVRSFVFRAVRQLRPHTADTTQSTSLPRRSTGYETPQDRLNATIDRLAAQAAEEGR